MTTTGAKSGNEWQRVTVTGTMSDNEWQQVTTSDNEWQRMTASGTTNSGQLGKIYILRDNFYWTIQITSSKICPRIYTENICRKDLYRFLSQVKNIKIVHVL